MPQLNTIEVITLFVDDIGTSKSFYQNIFEPEIVYEDPVSAVMTFGGIMVNLLQATEAPELVTPLSVAPSSSGSRILLTIRVEDVNATHADLIERGVTFLNGPIDRPWGRRTAAFADPSGHAWEIAQELS